MLGKLLGGGESTQAAPEFPFAFTLETERRLRCGQDYSPLEAWRFLTHHIRRYPQDLRAHTQRILLAQSEPVQDRLAGSLQDVFLALGNAGQQLRGRLLETVGGGLDDSTREFFKVWLDSESGNVGGSTQWRKGSILASGQEGSGSKLLHIERSQDTAQYGNVMEEVVACLEYGQIDTARDLLEAEVQAGRSDEAMEQELVNIYQYTRDKGRLDAMIGQLQEAGHEVSALWMEKQQESEHW